MVKLLHVCAAAERGGIEVVLLNILKTIDRSRFTPHVLFLENGPFVDEVKETKTPTHVIASGRVRDLVKGAAAVADIVRLIRSNAVQVVHCHGAKAHLYGGLAASIARVPSVYHLHGVPRLALSRDGVVNLMSMAVRSQRIIACSAFVAERFQAEWHSRREVRVVHNGTIPRVSRDYYSSDVREEFGIPRDSLLVVAATRLQRGKGVHVLLDAAAQVVVNYPNVCFVIVGGTLFGLEKDYPLELQRQAERLRLGQSLRFVGHQADVFRFYSEADIVVHAAVEPEGFGLVLLEAMSCGKPVVATNIGGPREIVESGATGVLVPPGDANSLAKVIEELLGDPDRRMRLGRAGAARARDRFDSGVMARHLEDLYEEIVEESARE